MSIGRVYSNPMIVVSSFLGGPLATAYLIAQNYKSQGNVGTARKAIQLGIMGVVTVGLLSVFLPARVMDHVSTTIVSSLYAAIGFLAAVYAQRQELHAFIQKSTKASWWRVVLVGLASFIVLLVVVTVFNIIAMQLRPEWYT